MKKLLSVFLSIGTFPFFYGQTPNGPGGVLNTAGASNLSLWLDANNGPALTGINVTSWTDLSGRSNTANPPAAVNRPKIATAIAGLNGLSAVRFDGTNAYLDAGSSTSLDMTQWSFFIVGKVNTNKNYNYFFGKGDDGTENYEFLAYTDPYIHTPIYFTTSTRTFTNTPNPTAAVNSYSVWQYDYSTGNGRAIYLNGATNTTDTENKTPKTNTLSMWIGNERSTTGRYLDGDIAELILFKSRRNKAERIVIENYLAAKYGLSLSTDDVYTMDNSANGNYDHDVAGVGQASDGTQQLDSRGTGIFEFYNVGGLANNRFLMWGDDNGVLNAYNTADIPSPLQARSNRIWRASNSGITSEDLIVDLAGLGAVTVGDLRLLIDKNGNGVFADETVAGGGIKSGFTSLGGTKYLLTGLNILDGERFTIGTINKTQTPLPIELVNFNALFNSAKKMVDLDWVTASENNNDFFTIQRSSDGIVFQDLNNVDGAGNSTSIIHYADFDAQPLSGISYYRLKQTDFDGNHTFSNIVPVNIVSLDQGGLTGFSLFPNPLAADHTQVNLKLEVDKDKEVLVVLRDLAGQEFYSKVFITSENDQLIALDPEKRIAPGTYLVVATSDNRVYSQRLVIK